MEPIKNLTIFHVADLRDKLLKTISAEAKPVLDLRDLQECDVAGLQLLVSLIKTANDAGKELRLNNTPDCFRKTAAAVGLDPNIFPVT